MTGTQSIDIQSLLGEEDVVAGEIVRLWETWKGAKAEWRDRVQEVKKYVYATSTRETTNVVNPHDHTTHIPKIAQIADNLEANYMSALNLDGDSLRFEGFDRESEADAKKKAIIAYIDTKNKLNNFPGEINKCIRDWIIGGNAFAGTTYVHEYHTDPDTLERVQGYVGPKVYRISPDDIEFNPFATDFDHSPKIIRSLKSLGELHRDLEESPELGYSQDIIDRILKSREAMKSYTETMVDKHMQVQFDGFGSPSSYYNSGYVEILEYFGDIYDTSTNTFYKNYVITVADRRYVLRRQPLNTWSGRPNIFHVAWRLRPDNLWGMGPLDNLVGMQYYINHLENARADAFDQMIDPDRIIVGDVEIERRGSAVDYYVVEGGSVGYLGPDTTILNADFSIQRKEQQMEEYAGAPREAMGIRSPGEKTATEIQRLETAASRIFQSKVNYFEEQFLERIINAEIEVARRNVDQMDIVRVMDDDFGVAEFLSVTKEDLLSNGKLIPVGARHFARQAAIANNLQSFGVALQQDQMMALHFPSDRLAKAWEDVLGFRRLELFEKFGRINEQLEMQRLQAAAQQIQQEEQQIPEELDTSGGPLVQGEPGPDQGFAL